MSTTTVERDVAPVPIVDISGFFTGTREDRDRVAREVTAACEGIGFMLVTGHVPSPDLVAAFMDVSSEFFRLPYEQKCEVMSPTKNKYQGYAAPGNGPGFQKSERQSFGIQRYDTVEAAIAAGYPADAGTSMLPALWPREPEGMRAIWRAYFEEMEILARRLLAIFEVGLGLPEGWFATSVDRDQSTLAVNYYSYDLDTGHDRGPYRFKAHVDGSILTILYQDDGPGCLQLHQRKFGWRDVPSVEGTFVVNLGELMARWTNDRFTATPHRVLHPDDPAEVRPRTTAPFFLKPNHDAVIAPIPELVADGEEPRYGPVTGRDWVKERTDDNYALYDSTDRFEELAARTPSLR